MIVGCCAWRGSANTADAIITTGPRIVVLACTNDLAIGRLQIEAELAAIRRFLLDLLARCPVGEWLSVASLVEYLKKHDSCFLIPKKPQFKHERDRKQGRYSNFYESKRRWGDEIDIN